MGHLVGFLGAIGSRVAQIECSRPLAALFGLASSAGEMGVKFAAKDSMLILFQGLLNLVSFVESGTLSDSGPTIRLEMVGQPLLGGSW